MRLLAGALLTILLGTPAVARDRAADFASALHLRSDQQPAYRSYMIATRSNFAVEARRQAEAQRLPQMTTPQQNDWSRAQLQTDLTMLDRQGAAVKRFYAQLTPEQRRTFDEATAPRSR